MEPGSTVASGAVRARWAHRRALCRDFARGSCRWGRRCRFLHGGNLARICRYFQSGFCRYGEHCRYQHVQEEPVPVGTPDGLVPTTRPDHGGPEPGTVPTAMAQGTVGAQPTLVCPAPSVAHEAFKFPNMEAEGEEKDKNIPALGNIPCGASGGEFVSTRPQSASGSQLQGLAGDPDSSNPRQTRETVTRTDPAEGPVELGAAAAPVPIEKLIAQSETVVCGICMERVYGKPQPEERLFGILPNCSHAYCVGCIRKWRRSEGFPNTVINACPECRITSNYYIPHQYWISNVGEKEELIRTFKAQMGKITCRFFARKGGNCQFGSDCIYLHELPSDQPQLEVPDEPSSSSSENSSEDLDEALMADWALTLPEEEREYPLGYDFDVLLFNFGDDEYSD